jgi:hypothetical protein
MKRICKLVGATAAIVFATAASASAADLPTKAYAPAPVVAVSGGSGAALGDRTQGSGHGGSRGAVGERRRDARTRPGPGRSGRC